MKSISTLITTLLLISFVAKAGEVDPFYGIDKEISDSKNIINKYLNNSINRALQTYNRQNIKNSSCEDVALYIMREIGTTDYLITNIGALNSDMELWVNANREIDRSPEYGYDKEIYAKKSIYSPQLKIFHFYPKEVDSTINIDGVHFGIDKLSHFLGSGYEYYKIYLEEKKENSSDFMAEFSAIKWGIEMENTILGLWAVEIFSYADLEANYQGLKMAQDLCKKSILKYDNQLWQSTKNIKIQKYINPDWDEAYNPNSYSDNRDKEIRENLSKVKICKNMNWERFNQRFFIYDEKTKNTNFNLSKEILKSFITNDKRIKKDIYLKIIKEYKLQETPKEIEEYFIELDKANRPHSLKSYCK